MIMSVRKGKRLISRLLPLLPSPQAAAVVMAIARNLPALAKKDKQDQVNMMLTMKTWLTWSRPGVIKHERLKACAVLTSSCLRPVPTLSPPSVPTLWFRCCAG